jgi:hypothetical protein
VSEDLLEKCLYTEKSRSPDLMPILTDYFIQGMRKQGVQLLVCPLRTKIDPSIYNKITKNNGKWSNNKPATIKNH